MRLSKAIEKYNHQRFGPLVAVSDEGSAAETIAEAGYAAAKAWAVDAADESVVGMMFDGERMGSAGEVPIGPDEYGKFLPEVQDIIYSSTNVGIRVNTRIYQPLPEFRVVDAGADEAGWLDTIFARFAPFVRTPDGVPRPLTVRLVVDGGPSMAAVRTLVPKLEAGRGAGKLGDPAIHRLSLLRVFDGEIARSDIPEIEALISLAAELEIPEVAIDGRLVDAARRRISVQGLLNVLDIGTARALLSSAKKHRVRLVYHYQVDRETAARTVWTGLNSAYRSGLSVGKYGLLPLSLSEQEHVVRCIQRWMPDWTPVPAFYVDTPFVTDDDIYDDECVVDACKIWLTMVASSGAAVVLIDAPDRIRPRRLLKRDENDPGDPGVLTMGDLAVLVAHANKLGLRALWSGGIDAKQAFELGKLGVFGFFTTGSTARVIPVQETLARDSQLAAEKEPTLLGVRRIHGLAQAGYLTSVLAETHRALREEIEARASALIDGGVDGDITARALGPLNDALVRGWKQYWSQGASGGKSMSRSAPVPPDAVRVWRGFREPGMSASDFVNKLGAIFIPGTVQVQAPVGLTAYLPTVLPPGKPDGIPDEIAIVFYETQQAYHDAKLTVGGRAYSDLHAVVFDLQRSTSGFPVRFAGKVEADVRYHLFDAHVDWQAGHARVLVGVRKGDSADAFLTSVGQFLSDVQQQKNGPDAAIAVASSDYVVYWEHWPDEAVAGRSLVPNLTNLTSVVYDQMFSSKPIDSRGLWTRFDGVSVAGGESFNMQFRRRDE